MVEALIWRDAFVVGMDGCVDDPPSSDTDAGLVPVRLDELSDCCSPPRTLT